MSHNHNHSYSGCNHTLKYCDRCDEVYCETCGKDWKHNLNWITKYPSNPDVTFPVVHIPTVWKYEPFIQPNTITCTAKPGDPVTWTHQCNKE